MNASIFRLDLLSDDVSLMRAERPPLFGIQVYDPQSQKGKYEYVCSGFEAVMTTQSLAKDCNDIKRL